MMCLFCSSHAHSFRGERGKEQPGNAKGQPRCNNTVTKCSYPVRVPTARIYSRICLTLALGGVGSRISRMSGYTIYGIRQYISQVAI